MSISHGYNSMDEPFQLTWKGKKKSTTIMTTKIVHTLTHDVVVALLLWSLW